MNNINMNWKQDGFTVYSLNEQGVNDFSFHVQGNGRKGHDPKKLQKVVSMASAAPDMYRALQMCKSLLLDKGYGVSSTAQQIINNALEKADGEKQK